MKSLKDKLNTSCLTIGSWITLAHPAIAEIMAKAGFDWIAVDLEHSVITIREAEELIRVISLCGVAPLVRLTSVDHDQIKRVMDAGAHGIVVPMVKSRDEARQAIEAMYYPMRGRRSVSLARAQGYGVKFDEYRQWLDDHGVVIVQIEHIEAVHHLESILSLEGIDGYIIGPYDLSASMGLPGQLDHPAVVAAIEEVRNVGSAMNKPGGVHIVEPDLEKLRCYIKEGFTFIAYSVDFRMIDTVCRTGLLAIGRGE